MSSVQSVERAFTVLRSLATSPAGVTELAERVDLPKSTVSRLLSTLEAMEVVEQVEAGGPYRLGVALIEIAGAVQPGRNLLATARPHLIDLSAEFAEAAGVSVIDGDAVHYLDQVESDNPVQVMDWTGERIPLHVVPSGLVLLAHLPRANADTYLRQPLERATAATMVDPAAIRARLDRILVEGHCWVYEEFQEGISSIAAPVFDFDRTVVAALHVHGPSYRFPPETPGAAGDIAEGVMAAAARMSEHLADPSELGDAIAS